jgi:hypothetical protein
VLDTYIDTRSKKEILMDIINLLSQCLDRRMADLWSAVCSRDITESFEFYQSLVPKLINMLKTEIKNDKLSQIPPMNIQPFDNSNTI